MGNSSSKPQAQGLGSVSSSPSTSIKDGDLKPTPNKTASHKTSTLGKSATAPPSATYESAVGQTQSRASSKSRPRSQTAAPALEHVHNLQDNLGNQSPFHRAADDISKPASTSVTPVLGPAADHVESAQPTGIPGHDTSTNIETSSRSPVDDSYYITPSDFGRPPRLPLPIDEQVVSPGSPILTAEDLGIQPDDELHAELPRKSSVLSSKTEDEEDGTEDQRAGMIANDENLVPTIVEWRHGGREVFVTGTFIGWNRKYKLFKDGPVKGDGVHSATIQLPAGTHHITFLVDNNMCTSPDLPTAVDFTNALVNWIEVGPDVSRPTYPESKDVSKQKPELRQQTDTPSAHLPASAVLESKPTSEIPPAPTQQRPEAPPKKPDTPKPRLPPKTYHTSIPRMLMDLDAPESSSRFARANTAVMTYPAPPSLPMMLNKSILNGTTPMKDDASVLIMPNHTVLNHLATSSIKNNVLATSATTRYKKKFLTTIMYKPTSETGS